MATVITHLILAASQNQLTVDKPEKKVIVAHKQTVKFKFKISRFLAHTKLQLYFKSVFAL